ncbi:MAG: polyphosphate kinase 1, partial [Clostridia bacterium]|nr:polyphosphate kinase 1 [Clostridia bacterium]
SNMDEFVQVRYHRLLDAGQDKRPAGDPSGLDGETLLSKINKELLSQQNQQYTLLDGLLSELYLRGVQVYPTFSLDEELRQQMDDIYEEELFSHLVPTLLDRPDEFPFLKQKQLHFFIELHHHPDHSVRFALLAIPTSVSRLHPLSDQHGKMRFVRAEDIIRQNLHRLFPEDTVLCAYLFRVIRNQDFEISVRPEVPDAVRTMLLKRRTGAVMRLEAEERMPSSMLESLGKAFHILPAQIYRVTGPLDLNKLMMKLYSAVPRDELKYRRVEPRPIPELMTGNIFEKIRKRDYLLFHPYHSFAPVLRLLDEAADDPAVRSVKQTLYRVSHNSPIVQALMRAAENGKQVTVLFEAKARFDEENNLFWGDRLRRAGCNVIFGLRGLKTHSKITLITRKENEGVQCYLHLGTGNYHDATAKVYTDFGLLTADETLGEDATSFFHQMEGYGMTPPMSELITAPAHMKTTLLQLIEREKEHAQEGRPSGIRAKMNSLSDQSVISALYAASQAGVPIDLIVRGVCCLVPGLPGVSENIRVRSIVGRHLEHARAFCFENGGETETYLSSADWMPRNLRKRVELMFPIKDLSLAGAVQNVLALQLKDTQKAWRMLPDGCYQRVSAGEDTPVNAQERLLQEMDEALYGQAKGKPPVPPIEEQNYEHTQLAGAD